MKYFVKYPFGITEILKGKLNSYGYTHTENIFDADFIYLRISSYLKNTSINQKRTYQHAKYVNNFIDLNHKLCITGDNCLANKYTFSKLCNKIVGNSIYIPKTYPFHKQLVDSLRDLDYHHNIYIIKPENDFARGGITLIYSYPEIKSWLQRHQQYKYWVLQKYIKNPLLINNKKFHFRSYFIMIKRPNKQFELYLFNKYFTLGASKQYNYLDKDLKGHLTGAKYCNVNVVTPELLLDNNIDFQRIHPEIVNITILCGKIAKKSLRQLYPYQTCFHLFACDLITSSNYKTQLLEVNNGGIGTEMNNLEHTLCPNGGSLHDTNVITQLFNEMIETVLNNSSNTNYLNLSNSINIPVIEHFNVLDNYNYNYNYLLVCLLLIILLIII